MRSTVLLASIALVACRTADRDPFAPAVRAVGDGALLEGLAGLDRVPPAHPRYGEARALAAAIERRVRAAHSMIALGLGLRAQWRDAEALRQFESAREVWPGIAGAAEMIAATRARMAALEPRPADGPTWDLERSAVVTTPIGGHPAPGGERAARRRRTTAGEAVDELLRRGQVERALDRVEEQRARGDSAELRAALARVLHLRALLNYGQGDLELAIADWALVLELEPVNDAAREFCVAAMAEQRSREGGALDAERRK